MTLKGIFIVFITLSILNCLYQYFEYWALVNSYKLSEFKGSLLEYAYNEIGSLKWRLRYKLKFRYYNNIKVYRNFTILNCVFLVLFSILLLVIYFLILFSEYGVYLNVKW